MNEFLNKVWHKVYMYFYYLFVALDQCLNAFLCGYSDETLSARSYRLGKTCTFWAFVRNVIDIMFFFDPNHCYTSYLAEKEGKHDSSEYRQMEDDCENNE